MRVLAVVPAYNESGVVGDVVRELRARGDLDVVVVDDGSVDDTASVARAAGARVLELPYNLGIGAAVQAGFRFANEQRYDVVVQVDGDGQHRPDEIGRLLEPIERGDADLVLGSRYVQKTGYHASPWRRIGMLIFSAVVSRVTGQTLRDTTSGFRASGSPVIEFLAEYYPGDYPEVEALVLLSRAGFRIVETPCRFREREVGRSSITLARSAYYMIKVMLAVLIGLFRRVPPTPGEESGTVP